MDGERRLWAAVLAMARRDLHGRGRVGRRHRDEAMAWLVSTSTTPGSFRWVCQQLRIDPATTKRRMLLELGQRYSARWLVRHTGRSPRPRLTGLGAKRYAEGG